MTANEIREEYLKFMEKCGYRRVAPVGLILSDDPTTLFTGSGMQPMVPYLLGDKHPDGNLLADSQPCIRTQDMEEVGDNRHTTFFEMLGDWSLSGFDKKQQIEWLFEFLTKTLGLDPEKLYVTCFIGDAANGIPCDDETANIWAKIFENHGISAKTAEIGSGADGDKRGIQPGERIFFYDDSQNWWSRNGGIASTPLGDPCGPDNEIFYDFGEAAHDPSFGRTHPASDGGRFLEICNKVWMQYRRQADGSFEPLDKGKVDFGGGLSRLAAAALDTPDIFKTDLYAPIIAALERLSGKNYNSNQAPMRVIADHLTAATWLASQGLAPSNKEQGYVMRRLTRRAILQALNLGIDTDFLGQLVRIIADIYRESYPIFDSVSEIVAVLEREETAFRRTLGKGLKMLRRFTAGRPGLVPESSNQDWIPGQARNDVAKEHRLQSKSGMTGGAVLTGNELFTLHDTYGFPLELSVEESYRQGIKLSENWRAEFDAAMQQQRQRSQTATKGVFKGGLEDHGEMTTKYHTAAHLTLAAMHKILSPEVEQKGSNITAERMRFDFAWPEKLTEEQIVAIENQVNEWIVADLPVTYDVFSKGYAFDELRAHGSFRDRYPDRVTVYTIGDFDHPVSREICGGPHVARTGILGNFKIVKEESSSAGVRRIKAILI